MHTVHAMRNSRFPQKRRGLPISYKACKSTTYQGSPPQTWSPNIMADVREMLLQIFPQEIIDTEAHIVPDNMHFSESYSLKISNKRKSSHPNLFVYES